MNELFTTTRETLLDAIRAPLAAVERRGTIPILSSLLVSVEGDMLTVTGTDLDVSVTSRRQVEPGGENTVFTVPAFLFHDLVSAMPKASRVCVGVDGESGAISLSSGEGRTARKARINTLSASDFPAFQAGATGSAFDIAASALHSALERVLPCTSTEKTRYYLCGVFFHCVDSKLALVATNGHTLGLVHTQQETPGLAEGNDGGASGVIVPNKTARMVLDMAASAGSEDIHLEISGSRISASHTGKDGEAEIISSKVIDGSFPDYNRVIPAPEAAELVWKVDGREMQSAAQCASAISSERGRAVVLEFEGDAVTVTSTNPETGTSQAAAAAVAVEGKTGEPFRIGVNSGYLMDLADAAGETMEFRFGGENHPIRISGRPDETFVLMPMRV